MMDMYNINPILGDPSSFETIQFYQTRETLMDTEEYSKFIYAVENGFRRSRFYKDYKSHIMNLGLTFDSQMKNITDEMVSLDLHHMLPELKDAAIAISEYFLYTKGRVCTFEVIKELEECHRNNMMSVVMLNPSLHQQYHASSGTVFISLDQCYGNFSAFIDKYGKYITLDIGFKWLYIFKQYEQHNGKTYWPNIARAREQLLNWSNSGMIQY